MAQERTLLGYDPNTGKAIYAESSRPVRGYDPNTGKAVYEDEPKAIVGEVVPTKRELERRRQMTYPEQVMRGIGTAVARTGLNLAAEKHRYDPEALRWIERAQATVRLNERGTFGEDVGRIGTDIVTATVPAMRGSQAIQQTTQALPQAFRTFTRAAGEGLMAAGSANIQGGGPEGAALAGATAAGVNLTLPIIARGVNALGKEVGNALIKASKADKEAGFHISNVYKHGLGGSLEQTLKKSSEKLGLLREQLRAELAKGGARDVNVAALLKAVEDDFAKEGARHVGQNANIAAGLERLRSDPWLVANLRNGNLDLLSAQDLKQAIGFQGAWSYGRSDADTAFELVANKFYSKLKTAIEQAAPAGPTRIRALNQQMSEIIPVRNAVIRRIPVADRQNVVNLGDMIGFGTGAWWLAAGNRILRSGQAGNMMVNASERAMRGLTPLSQIPASATSQIQK